MSKKNIKTKIKIGLKIFLPIACLLWLGFIFSNSLQTGEQSSAQSATVVETVQKVAKVIAPQSKVANATGEEYDLIHAFVRGCAHFMEFTVLGALLCWCYFSYTLRIKHFYLPILGIFCVPLLDEYLQSFIAGRGTELMDLALDICGGAVGGLLAVTTVVVGLMIYKRRIVKTNK